MSVDRTVDLVARRAGGALVLASVAAGCQADDLPMTSFPVPTVESSTLTVDGRSRAVGPLFAEWQRVEQGQNECAAGLRLVLRPPPNTVNEEWFYVDLSTPIDFIDGETATLAPDQWSIYFQLDEPEAPELLAVGGQASWSTDGTATHTLTITDASWCDSRGGFDAIDCVAGGPVVLTLDGVVDDAGRCATGEPAGSGDPPPCVAYHHSDVGQCDPVPDP